MLSNRLRKHAPRHYASGLDPLVGLTYDQIVGNAVLANGSVPMTDDLDMNAYKILFTNTSLISWAGQEILGVYNRAGTLLKGLQCGALSSTNWTTSGNPGYLKAGNLASRYVEFRDGNNAVIGGFGKDPEEFWITKAGDITFLDGKVLSWSDVNLYRSSADVLKTDDSLIVEKSGGFVKLYVDTVHIGALDTNIYRSGANVLKTDDLLDAVLGFQVNGVAGVDGSFTSADGKTVTVTKGIITSIV